MKGRKHFEDWLFVVTLLASFWASLGSVPGAVIAVVSVGVFLCLRPSRESGEAD